MLTGAGECVVLPGDCRVWLPRLPAESVHCVVTSPPYLGLRDYGHPDQLGLEETPAAYVAALVDVFTHLWRVLRADGTIWLNLGDSFARDARKGQHQPGDNGKMAAPVYDQGAGRATAIADLAAAGLRPKSLIGIPWRVALALQGAGWILRSDCIWSKPNAMPESVTDRPTVAHEHIFLLAKSERYYYDAAAVREPAVSTHASGNGYRRPERISRDGRGSDQPWQPHEFRNRRSVWQINTKPYPGAHFAVMPEGLVEPCILAGCPEGGLVLDPFGGAGTVGVVAQRLRRKALLIELNPEYVAMARERLAKENA